MSKTTAEKRSGAKLEGVFAKGYGVVPRMVMLDKALSPEAKLLYAYFCVLSSNSGGYQPCPPEELILSTLNISHTRYLRHRKSLTEGGYIAFSQARRAAANGRQLYEGARYLIVKSAPAQGEGTDASSLPLAELAAVQEGIFAQGFGLVPRLPLFDRKLSIEAKAAYVFLCVYANAATRGERVSDVRAALMEDRLMGRKRAQHAIRELTEAGYVDKRRHSGGLFTGNSYILRFEPQAAEAEVKINTAEMPEPQVKINTAENPPFIPDPAEVSPLDTPLPKGRFAIPEAPDGGGRSATAEIHTAEIATAKIETAPLRNTTENKTISKTNTRSINTSPRQTGGHGGAPLEICLVQAEAQLEADILREVYDGDLIDGITLELARVYAMDPAQELRADGRAMPAGELAAVYRRLRFKHIEYVIATLRDGAPAELRNPQAYLRSCLYNAPFTLGLQDMLKLSGD